MCPDFRFKFPLNFRVHLICDFGIKFWKSKPSLDTFGSKGKQFLVNLMKTVT